MKLGTRIFISFALVLCLGLFYPVKWILDTTRTRYLEGVEELLVDHANLLASIVSADILEDRFRPENLHQIFDTLYNQDLSANIYSLKKKNIDIRVYITDHNGKLIFDSEYKNPVGTDYSKWNDVYLTLKGEYGARATHPDPENPKKSVLHVAAPIKVNDSIWGVLTVAKPTTNINKFLAIAKPQILTVVLISIALIIFFWILLIIWFSRPIKRLTKYAQDIRDGKRANFPRLDKTEIGEMGTAFEEMQEALEGKKYIEQYVQTLTHEIKSPISAIKGAAEILEEAIPDDQRNHFLRNIRSETSRIENFVERMLKLSSIESQREINKDSNVPIKSLIANIIQRIEPLIKKKEIKVIQQIEEEISIKANSFLLSQAISNLIINAVEFSNKGDSIILNADLKKDKVQIHVIDEGPGIPSFAMDKIFQKFYSLQRPDTGRKSTGLGLNFVREITLLHNGDIRLFNREGAGTEAILTLPVES